MKKSIFIFYASMLVGNYLNICLAQSGWSTIPINGISGTIEFDQSSKTLINVSNGTIGISTDYGLKWKLNAFPYDVWLPHQIWIANKDSFFFTSTDIGVFATINGGKTIEKKMDGVRAYWKPYNNPFITGNPSNKRELWLCFDDLYHSNDFGVTWDLLFPSVNMRRSFCGIAVHPRDPSTLYLISDLDSTEFFKSSNGGMNWFRVFHNSGTPVLDIIATPMTSIYAGLWVSIDAGLSWNYAKHDMAGPINLSGNGKYSFDYKTHSCYTANGEAGLLQVKDGSDTYIPTRLSSTDFYSGERRREGVAVVVDTSSENYYTILGDSLYTGKDSSFKSLTSQVNTISVYALYQFNSSGDTIIAATAAGMSKSKDKGNSWYRINDWSSRSGKYIARSTYIPGFVLISGGDGGQPLYFPDGGETWTYVESEGRTASGLKFDPFDSSFVYGGEMLFWRIRDSLFIKASQGSRLSVEQLNKPALDMKTFTFDKIRKGVIYIGGLLNGEDYVYRSVDYSKTWERLGEGVIDDTPIEIIVHPTNPSKLFVATPKGIFRSTDYGSTWSFSDFWFESKNITCMVIDSAHPNILFTGAKCRRVVDEVPDNERRGGVYQSTDSGATWSRLADDGLYNWNVKTITLLQNPRRLMIGTEAGAYEYILPPITSVEKEKSPVAEEFILGQNYPNPFSRITTIQIDLTPALFLRSAQDRLYEERVRCSFKVYDVFGREVLDISNQITQQSNNKYQVQITDAQLLASGLYFYRLSYQSKSDGIKTLTKKMYFIDKQ